MRAVIARVISLIFLSLVGANEESDEMYYTNSWAVHVEKDDLDGVNELAKRHGFTNLGQIGSLPGYFHFVKESIKERNKRSLGDHTELLLAEPMVKWVKQQRVLERSKRNIFPEHEDTEREKRDMAVTIQDPFYKDQWYLQNIGQSSGPSGLDINVLPAWGQGYSGKGVVVSILDDGVDHTHPDLKKNYDPVASFDFNDFDSDPKPRSEDPLNCHGTKCAGEIAAEANNGICGVGVSFNASIGGIRMLDGKPTDTIEGSSLSFHSDYIDIYTCSWGPKDDGKRFGKPGFLASKALKIGAEKGRGGKGNIYVWATGNGGLTDDDCNCDGYTTSIYTVSIGAISDHGLSTYYTETCASTLAVTFSGASHRETEENKIVTTSLHHKCTKTFKGTSSAAPLASGMLALVLEANPNLTWRDVQHIIVETSQKTSPLDEGWKKNGAGKEYNHKFGFGKLDAMKMIEKAKSWENVPKQRVCYSKEHDTLRNIPSSGDLIVSSNTSSCAGTTSEISKLEHVQVKMSLEHRHRGHLSITLISPSGTRSELLKTRRNDHSAGGLTDWVFMSVHFWSEDPKGSWTLIVTDNDRNTREHHVTKAKQGDFEDVTRVVMDDTEKQGPWDADKINEYESTEQAPPRNHSSQDHILKGMENTMGELVKGDKFTELAKRKKDRKHGAKGIVGKTSGHAQYKHKSNKHGGKKKYKYWTKKKTKNYKTETNKHKDLETKENTKKSKKKHKYYKHKGHKHKHRKDTRQDEGGGKSLMAEGSLEIPKGRTPLEAKIAIQALMEPYFKVSASRIVLPKRYQGFMGEVDIKMKLVKERNRENMGQDGNEMGNHRNQLESGRETSFSKAQSQQTKISRMLEIPEAVKQINEVKDVTYGFGAEPFRIPSKEIKVLEAARQNTELQNTSIGTPAEIQGGKTTNDDNVYKVLLNTIKSMPHNRVADPSFKHLDERIDILTDAKPYTYDNSTNMPKHLNNDDGSNSTIGSNVTGSEFTGNNTTGSELNGREIVGSNMTGNEVTRRNATGSDLTGGKFEGNSLKVIGFSGGNSSERNTSGNHLEDDIEEGTIYNVSSNTENVHEAVHPDAIPMILYDPVKNQFAEVRKLNASEPSTSVVTGNEVTGTGSKNTNGTKPKVEDEGEGEEVPDESSGFDSSSGVVIEEETVCNDGNAFGINCQITEQDNNGLIRQSTEELNNVAEEPSDDEDDESDNTHVTEDVVGIPQPQGSHGFEISTNSPTAKMQPPNEEDKLAYLLSTGKYQGLPDGTLKQGPTHPKESRPLKASDSKDQNVPDRFNNSTESIQDKESKTLQTSVKHQNVPGTPSLKKGLSQPGQKSPLHQKDQKVPNRPYLKKRVSQSEQESPLKQKYQNVPDSPGKQKIGPTPSNRDIKIDVSELEPLDQFANKDLKALENALEKQVDRLEKFRDDSPTGSRFLQRVKDDIRHRNVDDLKFLEDEIRNEIREAFNGREDERKGDADVDGSIAEPRDDSDDSDENRDDDGEEFHRLEKRRLSELDSNNKLIHHDKNSRDNVKYGKGNSGILKSWTLILYGT